MINILTNAPTWAWAVLTGLIVLGGLQTMSRRLPLPMIVVLPVLMTALSLYSVGASFTDSVAGYGAWSAGALGALTLNGLLLRSPAGVRYDAAARRYALPGSLAPLVMMLAIFATRFATIATLQVNPAAAASPAFVIVTSALLGFLAGMFVSRTYVIVSAARAVTAPA